MFKKEFTPGPKSKVKSSVQRAIRTRVLETYPGLEPHVDLLLPKKGQLDIVKIPDRVSLYCLDGRPLFWQHMDDPIIPHLRVVHEYPWAFPRLRIDRGGVRFVLSGATLMVPGLTSAGGRLPGEAETKSELGDGGKADWGGGEQGGREMEAGSVVVVDAEGKEHSCMVGVLKMGTKEMKEKKKGVGIENGHYVGDGLWKLDLS